MKTLQELRNEFQLKVSPSNIFLKSFAKKQIDWDVYLPTKNKNLQRGFVWSLEQKREIVMSILLERYIPRVAVICIYNPEIDEEIYQIIDGKQRLSSMIEFLENKFTISLEGKEYYFDELPEDYKIDISNYPIPLTIVYEHNKKITDQ